MAIKNSWASGEVLTAADLTDTFKGVFVNAQTGTSYTLDTADSFVSISNASGGTVTIPTNATAAFNTGAVVGIMNAGTAGTFTIGTAAGVTLNSTTGGTTLLPLETVYVVKLGTNTWQTKRDPGIANAGGLVYITGSTFTTSTGVNVNNCFTSTYDSYRIMIDVTAFSTTLDMLMRLRVSGADNSTTNYSRQTIYGNGTGAFADRTTGASSWVVNATNSANAANLKTIIDIFAPNLARRTVGQLHWMSIDTVGSLLSVLANTTFTDTTVFDGFSLLPSTGNFSGTVRVYGYRNS